MPARQMLAQVLSGLQRWEPAAEQFRVLAERTPRDPRVWHGLGLSYEGLAKASYEELQRGWPDSPFLLLLTADSLVAEGKYANALRLYREAAERRPLFREPREAMARVYARAGHADWAATAREKAEGVLLPDCRARPSLECDFRAGRYLELLVGTRSAPTAEVSYWRVRAAQELAVLAFARLRGLPASPEAALIRARDFSGQGSHVEAAAELKQAMQSWPDDARIRRELATALHRSRDYEAASVVLEELSKQQPDSAEVAFLLGDAYLQQRQAEKAIPQLESAVEADPRFLSARAALGRAYLLAGDPARALPHLEAARETDQDGSLNYQLSRAYQALGQGERAAEALRRWEKIREGTAARQQELQREFEITPP